MSSYRTHDHTGNTTTPTPDALNSAGGTVAALRHRLRVAEQSAAIARAERTRAEEARDTARDELARVRTALAGALGGADAIPVGSSTADLAAALVRDLMYARGTAATAHAARRVAEATIQRLLGPVDAAAPESRCAHTG